MLSAAPISRPLPTSTIARAWPAFGERTVNDHVDVRGDRLNTLTGAGAASASVRHLELRVGAHARSAAFRVCQAPHVEFS